MGVYTWVKIGCKYPLQTGQYWVQINSLKDGRIEACKQLGSNDDQLQGVGRITKAVKQSLL